VRGRGGGMSEEDNKRETLTIYVVVALLVLFA
jgi:hypothetical protein